MIKLLKLITGESVCGEESNLQNDKEFMLFRPLYFLAFNEAVSAYEATYCSLLKYDFIADTELVGFNRNLIVSITTLYDEGAEWYRAVSTYVYENMTSFTKKNLAMMTEQTLAYQKKIMEAIASAAANTETSDTETTDTSWADKVDTKNPN